MGANNQGNGSNPADVNQQGENTTDDQSGGTSDESQPSEQDTGQSSGAFTGVDREQLTPEMQGMYDSMNRDYTQKNQQLADLQGQADARRDFAAIGELVENNSNINKLVWDEVNRQRTGQPSAENVRPDASTDASVAPQGDISPEEAAGRAMINEEVMKVVAPVMQQIQNMMGPVNQMSTYMSQNQAATEYQLLCQKYPAAVTIRPQELQTTQLQFQRTGDGGSITMEQAFGMMALKNPALLTATPDKTPSGENAAGAGAGGNKSPAGVERGGAGSSTEGGSFREPGNFQKLKELAGDLLKSGSGGLPQAADRAREKFRQAHPNIM